MSNKTRSLMIAGIVLLMLIGLFLSLFISSFRSVNTATSRAYDVLTDSIAEQASTLTAVLAGQFQTLDGAAVALIENQDPMEQQLTFLGALSDRTDFARIGFITAKGLFLSDQNEAIDVSDRAYYQKATAGERSMECVVDRVTGRDCVVLSIPYAPEGQPAFVLAGIYYNEDLRQLLTSKAYGGEGYSCVINRSGELIVGTDEEYQFTEGDNIFNIFDNATFARGDSADELKRAITAGERAVLRFTYGGQERIAVAVPFNSTVLPENDWVVLNLVNTETLSGEIIQGKEDILEGIKIIALFTLGAGVLFVLLVRDNRRKMMKEADLLRLQEEQFRIVAKQSEQQVLRYDITNNLIYVELGSISNEIKTSTPEGVIQCGWVAPESVAVYLAFFQRLAKGESHITEDFLMQCPDGVMRWFRHTATTLFSGDGVPQTAVISCMDYTELRMRDQAWNKWQQEMKMLPLEKTACYEWNLTKDISDREYGSVSMDFSGVGKNNFDARTDYYVKRRVHSEDKAAYLNLVRRELLLGMYYSGKYSITFDYRHVAEDGSVRWHRLCIQLFPYQDTQDVKAYMLDQDIDEEKRRELELLERSQRDPLTCALNRATFVEQVEKHIHDYPNGRHALLMLDLDGFKKVNDLMGHGMGDDLLAEFAGKCRSMLRSTDMIGRMGGDEFMIFLPDIGATHTISEKAQRLCQQLRRRLHDTITVTVSIGISVFPQDGTDFPTLYEKADKALYYAKGYGRNRFIFYDSFMEHDEAIPVHPGKAMSTPAEALSDADASATILVVDDASVNRIVLKKILEAENHRILEAENGVEALKLLKTEPKIDLVILDIIMPEMGGYEVMERMHSDPALSDIPIVIVTGVEDTQTLEKAFAYGAEDFITKPVSPQILRIRVSSILDRQRSERLRLERVALELQLKQQAMVLNQMERDALTGLLNREAFFQKAAEIIEGSAPGSYVISCFDVDGFKVINDQYGVEVGDRLLVHVAKAVRQGFRQTGGFAGRISADNFIGIYPVEQMDSPEIVTMWEKAAFFKELELKVTLSIGRYVVEDISLSLSAMQDRAVLAKETVKGRYDTHMANFDESMRDELLKQRKIVSEMDEALATGQFEIWLQGQYDLISRKSVGTEALVRWRHPQNGIVSPGEFIPVFERNGFVYTLDQYVWEQVCILLRRWLDEGRTPLPVSVNVSRCDIYSPDFFDTITGLVERYAIPPNLVRLEITESAFTQSTEQIVDVAKKLQHYGFVIEIDDFGSGYSSLNTLKDVSANILKLDMRFLENDKDSKRGGSILESVMRMSRWLNMSVIAEGVETQQQIDFLRSIGCRYAQGYFYARPQPVEEFENNLLHEEIEPNLLAVDETVILDNNAFWNPDSIETLIFNSYVGGAVVMEYTGTSVEFLRINDRYLKETGLPLNTNTDSWKDVRSSVDDDIYEKLIVAIHEADRTGEEAAYEAGRHMPDGKIKYTRSRIRIIARAPGRLLLYGVVENITDRVKDEMAIRDSADQLAFLNSAARKLMANDNADTAIHDVLEETRIYFGGTRAYIFEYIMENNFVCNTYEVCSEGISSQIANLQCVSMDGFSLWNDTFRNKDYLYLPAVQRLDGERAGERKLLEAQEIQSLLAVPLYNNDALIGFMGVDDPTQNQHAVERMTAIGDYMAVMLNRRDLTAQLMRDNEMLTNMMRDMPGGFVRMRANPDGSLIPLFINDKMVQQLGISRENIMELYRNDAFFSVHPADKEPVRAVVHKVLNSSDVLSTSIRLMNGGGSYTEFRVFYRSSVDSDGTRYINGYYTDLSDEHKDERLRNELLDHLPFGAGIYQVSGGVIDLLYINRKFCEMIGCEKKYMHKDAIDSVHPDDVKRIYQTIQESIADGSELTCDVRIIGGNGEYVPMRIFGSASTDSTGKTLLYATYSKLDQPYDGAQGKH